MKNRGIFTRIETEKDKLVFKHLQYNEGIKEKAELIRKHGDNGWTKGKGARLIATIPVGVFVAHPEFYNDTEALRRYLQTDEGRLYKTTTR